MSATRNPRVHVREGIYEDKPSFVVEVDGDPVASIAYGKVGHAKRGEGEMPRTLAEFTAEGLATVLVTTLPPEPVKVALRATVIAYVTGEGVTEVHILPDQEDITTKHLYDAGNNSEAVIEAAVTYVDENVWEPLNDLPDNVVWEG